MASVSVASFQVPKGCENCKGKLMTQVFPNVYAACRNCLPFEPKRKAGCSVCFIWKEDTPCPYCNKKSKQ